MRPSPRTGIPRTPQPINILSRGNLLLPTSFTPNGAISGIWVMDALHNPQDGFFYLLYIDGSNKYGLARGSSMTGPWTDQGYISGFTAIDSPENGRLILDLATNKWGLFYITAAHGNLGLYQTAASAPITGPYTLTSSTLITPGTSGAWDDTEIREPTIFKKGSTWYCFYMATSVALNHEQSGYATASQPEGPWTKYASNPVIASGGAGSFDNVITADPTVISYGGVYHILYSYEGQQVSSGNGSAAYGMAVATTTDFITFTKRGIVFPPAIAAPGINDCGAAWKGSFLWAGKEAGDNSLILPTSVQDIYYYYLGRPGSNTATGAGKLVQSYWAKFDAQSFFSGVVASNTPWTRVEAESFAAPLTTVGAHDNTANWHDVNAGSGSVWTRGWSGAGAIWNNQVVGNSQMLSWTGRRARIQFISAFNYGTHDIFLDGVKVSTFDENYLAGLEAGGNGKVYGYDTGDLAPGPHTLKVTATANTSGTGTFLGLDYWEYI